MFPLDAEDESQEDDGEDLQDDDDTADLGEIADTPPPSQSPIRGRGRKSARLDDSNSEIMPKKKKQKKTQAKSKDTEEGSDEDDSEKQKGDTRNIEATVKKMKSVLSPKKMKTGNNEVHPDDALIHVIQPEEVDDYIHDGDDDEFSPMASTIIIVKPSDLENSTPTSTPVSNPKPKKEVPRVHTVTMSSGKQIVYKSKGKKGSKKEKDKDQEKETEPVNLDQEQPEEEVEKSVKSRKKKKEAKETPAKTGLSKDNEKENSPLSSDVDDELESTLHEKWKSVGIESEQLGSGDVVIDAEALKNATESFSVTLNDTEYNFEIQEKEPISKTSTKLYSYAEKKPKISFAMPVNKVQCMVCGKTLLNYSYLYRHVRHFHKDIQDVDQYLEEIRPLMKTPCPLCGKEISSISNMSSHIQQCHPSTPEPYRCEECGGYYKTRISLKHHMQSQHTPGRKKFPCKYCGNLFTESRSLREHINCTHETTEVFSCEVCKKTFLTRGRLRRHMYIHGEFRLFCKYCGKGFHLKDNMNKHIDLMHEKKNPNRFKCEYCTKSFNVKGNLMQHINGVHLKTLPYRCPICDQGFRKKGFMLGHMKNHAVKKQEYEDDDEEIEKVIDELEEEEDSIDESAGDVMNSTVEDSMEESASARDVMNATI